MTRLKYTRPRKHVDMNIQANPEVEQAMVGFKPRFGDDADIRIINTYSEIKKLLAYASTDEIRRIQMREITKTQRQREKDIHLKEKNLLWLLQNRG